MSAPISPHQLRIRLGLVAGILVSFAVLVMVWQARRKDRGPSPAPLAGTTSSEPLSGGAGPVLHRVRFVDAQGVAVPGAEVFVLSADGRPPPGMLWAPEKALLSLPASDSPRSLRVTARGFRTREVGGIVGSREIVLQRGVRVQVLLRDMPNSGLPETVRILLRIKPADADQDLERARESIQLMDNLGDPDSGPKDMPRRGFGYPVSRAQARAGILLPQPGSYYVHWGLIDTRQITWFSLGDPCGRRIEVRGDGEEQTFHLLVTLEDLQKTLDGLESGVAEVKK